MNQASLAFGVPAGLLRRFAAAAALLVLALGSKAATAATFKVANPYASTLSDDDIAIGKLTIFGDSYSAANRANFHNWAERLTEDDGEVGTLADFAKSGATAGVFPGSSNNFSNQVKKWLATSPTFGSSDLTVVYLGYNDIDGGTDPAGGDLANSEADYKAALKRVIGAGANGGGRRILLIMPHNWGRSPFYVREGGTATMRKRTQVWDSFVAKTAQSFSNTYGNIVAVDMYTALETVFNSPGDFGFTNVTTADHAHSATTAFYDDDFHPGAHGQSLIKQVIQYYLTRGWDWSNTYKSPSQAKAKLVADLNAGNVFTPQAAMVASAQALSPATTAKTAAPTGGAHPGGFGYAWDRHLAASGAKTR